jgi:hypothetical protein
LGGLRWLWFQFEATFFFPPLPFSNKNIIFIKIKGTHVQAWAHFLLSFLHIVTYIKFSTCIIKFKFFKNLFVMLFIVAHLHIFALVPTCHILLHVHCLLALFLPICCLFVFFNTYSCCFCLLIAFSRCFCLLVAFLCYLAPPQQCLMYPLKLKLHACQCLRYPLKRKFPPHQCLKYPLKFKFLVHRLLVVVSFCVVFPFSCSCRLWNEEAIYDKCYNLFLKNCLVSCLYIHLMV